ncbi:hypothetical protein EXU85_05905 [Spirosoma sp. KCTC 42546]|uniref:hypothetical protein n=1 Tax=Spirosoma sp. KCTC 42546 TaxID=2520506 RepID=UPI00115A5E67|nr:hypothetical protein [Spirosoma sp. KCTC 42546]QDK78154.1 hypothetical protein EXU85_05905 [Spirosoma sp. KCTC 42546]
MKRFFFITSLLSSFIFVGAFAQSGQSPAVQQSTSTTDTRQANPPRPKMKSTKDTTSPKNRKQRRLAPDSLRRGGATRVDTIR